MNKTLFHRAGELEEASCPFALVTILKTSGSASRNQGSMLVEGSKAITATIGGGALEAFAIEAAHKAIARRQEDYAVSFTVDQEAKKKAGEVILFIQVIQSDASSPFFTVASEWEQRGIPFVFGFSLEKESSRFLYSSTQKVRARAERLCCFMQNRALRKALTSALKFQARNIFSPSQSP